MGIQEDAAELLTYFYIKYNEDESVDANKLLADLNWDGKKADRAMQYLKDLHAINITLYFGNVDGLQSFNFNKLTPIGINMVEDKKQFKKTFNIEVNLLFAKFGWGAQER
jgi:hypothetical protein